MILIPEKDTKELKIKFNGISHQIEANTFINVFINLISLIQNINIENDEAKKVEIVINASPKPGSFILDLIISTAPNLDLISNLFKKDSVNYAASLVTILGGIIGVAQFLEGEKPSKIETINNHSIKLENCKGNITIIDKSVYAIFEKPSVKDPIKSAFESLDSDLSVTGFDLLDKNGTQISHVPREDFIYMTGLQESELESDEITIDEHATLNIVSMDWELKKKWDFYYHGNKINAKIKDQHFADDIKNGKPFRMGDSLEVIMEIRKRFDGVVDTYVNKSYTIRKILNHHPRPNQSRLNFE
jgi:hypothetical protein